MNVSIIIPVHNSEKYLEECVNSVLSGINEDDEIILVENGSSDSSWDMCQNYSSQYPNIKAVSLDTAGVSIARNKGISLADCEWIHFLDSDDVLGEGAVQTLLTEVYMTDADIVQGGWITNTEFRTLVQTGGGYRVPSRNTIWLSLGEVI